MKNTMKKIAAVLTAIALTASFTACSNTASSSTSTTGSAAAQSTAAKDFKIGVIQYATHPSLDNCYNGFKAGLEEAGYKDGSNITIDFQNAQGDNSNGDLIAKNMVSKKYDLIMCDSHAYLSSPLAGFTAIGDAKPMPVRIPYGCFIPQQLEGLLVGAKAISGERDATSFCRMNADMVNQGYALGCAAAAALAAGGRVREVDLAALRRELRAAGVLPDWAFADREAVAAEILPAADDKRLQEMLTFPAAEAVPLLEERWRGLTPPAAEENPFTSERSTVALALAWYGSAVGGDLIRELLELARKKRMHLTMPPVNPDRTRLNDRRDTTCDFHRVNRLLTMAGRSGAEGFTAVLAAILDDTAGPGEPVARIMNAPFRKCHR